MRVVCTPGGGGGVLHYPGDAKNMNCAPSLGHNESPSLKDWSTRNRVEAEEV